MKPPITGFMQRRHFLGLATATVAYHILQGISPFGRARASGGAASRPYRIAPIPGERYTPRFLRFAARARFASVHAAAAAIRNPHTKYQVLWA